MLVVAYLGLVMWLMRCCFGKKKTFLYGPSQGGIVYLFSVSDQDQVGISWLLHFEVG